LYGNSIKKELIGVTAGPATAGKGTRSRRKEKQDADEDEEDQEDEDEDQDQDEDEDMEVKDPDPSSTPNTWSAQIYITSSHYQARKTTFLLFINHRLVDSPRFKRALETAYIGSLPKHACPFIYLSLLLPPHTVDVNVHPTKREVHFLDEDAIVEAVADEVQKALLKGEKARTRTFEYQVGATMPN
jgi:DNA mismatch repair protein MLH1